MQLCVLAAEQSGKWDFWLLPWEKGIGLAKELILGFLIWKDPNELFSQPNVYKTADSPNTKRMFKFAGTTDKRRRRREEG